MKNISKNCKPIFFKQAITKLSLSLVMACLQIYREWFSLASFLQVHLNWKEVSYFCWQNMCPNPKNICHIKLKYFLWTKDLEKLLHAKYFIPVAATLKSYVHQDCFHPVLSDESIDISVVSCINHNLKYCFEGFFNLLFPVYQDEIRVWTKKILVN